MSTAKSSILTGSAAAERDAAGDGGRAVVSLLVPFAAYALALAFVSAQYPYRPALDDNEWLYLAHSVAERGELANDSVFMRVPLWQLMLGGVVGWAGDRAGVLGLQVLAAAGAFWLLARCALRGPGDGATTWRAPSALLVAVVFAVSPQLVLYSRHAVTELWVGLFAMAVVALGGPAEKFDRRRAALLGAAVGAAAMTKFSALVLLFPAAIYSFRARPRLPAAQAAVWLLGGFAAVVVPLVAMVALQRGFPLDDTSAFNLGPLDIEAWEAAGGSAARSALAMQGFRDLFAGDPFGYLADAGLRAVGWFAWPSSLDLLIWIPEYPALVVESLDHLVFFMVLTLAALGTTRRNWPAWVLPIALWVACAAGQKTPHSPKVAILFPLLLLAPAGLDALRGWRR